MFHAHTKTKFEGQSAEKREWKERDGETLSIDLSSRLTWSVIHLGTAVSHVRLSVRSFVCCFHSVLKKTDL